MHISFRLTTLARFPQSLLLLAKKRANGLAHNLGVLSARMRLNMNCSWEKIEVFNVFQLQRTGPFKMTLLQIQCELDRTQMLTILKLTMQNTRLAGYMLTGNRSRFVVTDGSVARLYHCPKFLSPP